jgi:hypothetical protein
MLFGRQEVTMHMPVIVCELCTVAYIVCKLKLDKSTIKLVYVGVGISKTWSFFHMASFSFLMVSAINIAIEMY